jgi:bifunctional ADP-heptose synthase (sugar kinase/adenylyltransferase)
VLTVVGDDEPATRLEQLLAERQIRAVLRRIRA